MDRLKSRTRGVRRGSGRAWDEVDSALVALIRLVLDQSWTAERAGAELRARVRNDQVLLRVRARVRNALDERPTPVARRAARTLDMALARPGSVTTTGA